MINNNIGNKGKSIVELFKLLQLKENMEKIEKLIIHSLDKFPHGIIEYFGNNISRTRIKIDHKGCYWGFLIKTKTNTGFVFYYGIDFNSDIELKNFYKEKYDDFLKKGLSPIEIFDNFRNLINL